jgi:glycine/D-amino acid oxidase-like deaminating enzyme
MDHAKTYYAASARDTRGFGALERDLTVDVAIVGGGFSGVTTALELAERGLSVALCEAHKIGWGATGRNGGQITGSLSGDKAMEREFRRSLGDKAVDFVWDLRWRGHDIIKSRIEKYDIKCDLRFGQMQTAMTPSHMRELQATYDAGVARGMGDDLTMISAQDMPDYLETDLYIGGLLNMRNMHVHPLDLCVGEARAAETLGAHIYEDTKVTGIEYGTSNKIITNGGTITAKQILIAGNAYHDLEPAKLSGKLFPASLANMATVPLDATTAHQINPKNLAVYDSRFVLDYYRLSADSRLIFGGGTNYSGRPSQDIAAELRPAMERTFPRLTGVEIEFAWEGLDGIILNRIPQVGQLAPGVFYAQGYSGHGIALTHIMGEVLAEMMTGNAIDFDTFQNVSHWHMPLGRKLGSLMVAVGMVYYKIVDRFK